MKWEAKPPPKSNEFYIRSGFLFFPKVAYNAILVRQEYRWLCFAKWKERWQAEWVD